MQGVPCINQQAVKNLWMEKNVLACRNTKETCGKHNVTLVGSQLCSLLLKVVWSCMWLPSVFEGPRKSKLHPPASISLIFPILSCTTRSSSLESSFSLCLFDLGGVVCNQYACQIDEFLDGVPTIYIYYILHIIHIFSIQSKDRHDITVDKARWYVSWQLFMCSACASQRQLYTTMCRIRFQDRGHEID